MVEQGRDVQDLIKSWHDMFHLGGLVATLPWLIHPIISSPVLKNYLMPQKGQSRGSGYVMSVSNKWAHYLLGAADVSNSYTKSFSIIAWQILN